MRGSFAKRSIFCNKFSTSMFAVRNPLALVSGLPRRWRCLLWVVFLAAFAVALYVGHYLATKTPLPVYVLDKLNLRPFFLPEIMCSRCNNFTVRYLVEEGARCKPDEPVFLLNFLISYSPNVRARQAVRQTWGGVREYRRLRIRTLFVFGVHTDKNFNAQLSYEQRLHGDIVQGDFTEDYRHLTEKTVMALRWITLHCPQAKYVLKTDDDSFNHVHRIVDYLLDDHVAARVPEFVGGYCFTVTPDRRRDSKYYVPHSAYPDLYYPTYCAGPGYVLSAGAVRAILNVAPNVTYLPMEDVYVAGMCRAAARIPYTNIPGMVISQDDMDACLLLTWAKNAHNVVPENQVKLWQRALAADPRRDCLGAYLRHGALLVVAVLAWLKLLLHVMRRTEEKKGGRGSSSPSS